MTSPRELPAAVRTNGGIRAPRTAEIVAAALRGPIVRGELAEGEALPPEASLLELFGVSRPTLREAFRVLESQSLITIRRGSNGGARVLTPRSDVAARYAGLVLEYRGTTLSDVCRTAADIEGPCAGLLARRRTAAQLALLRSAVAQEESADVREVLEAQVALHSLVLELCGNETLRALAEMLRMIIDTASRKALAVEKASTRQVKATHRGSATHRQLLELVESQDQTAAEALWRGHVRDTALFLEKTLGPQTVLDLLD